MKDVKEGLQHLMSIVDDDMRIDVKQVELMIISKFEKQLELIDELRLQLTRLKEENRKLSAHNKHMHRQLELADRERRKVHGSLGGYK